MSFNIQHPRAQNLERSALKTGQRNLMERLQRFTRHRWFFSLHEVAPSQAAELDYNLVSARNGVILPHDAHRAFDAKQALNIAQSPLDLRNIKFADRDRFSKSYCHEETIEYALYLWLDSHFETEPDTITQGVHIERLHALHPSQSDICVMALRDRNSTKVYRSAMGRVSHVLQNQICKSQNDSTVSYVWTFGTRRLALTAVKSHPASIGKWQNRGTMWRTDKHILELDLESANQDVLNNHMTSEDVLASWWSPVRKLHTIRPPHP